MHKILFNHATKFRESKNQSKKSHLVSVKNKLFKFLRDFHSIAQTFIHFSLIFIYIIN